MALLAVGLSALLPAGPVYADTPDPDTAPSVLSFNVYRHLLEDDDYLLIIYANIPYATPPDTPVNETFIWRMIDTDDVTELGSTVGFAYNDNGFGNNVYSMYWSAANVTDLGIVWGTEYTVTLSGNPAVFDTPPKYNYTIDSTDYTTFSSSADIKLDMGTRVITIALDLNIKWALTATLNLTQESEIGTILSIYGEAFFRGAIFGLQGMVPQIFRYVVTDMEVTAREWDTDYVTSLEDQWSGTWVGTAKEAGALLFGTGYDLLSLMFVAGMSLGVIIGNLMTSGDTWAGIIDASFVLLLSTKLAFFGLGYLGLIAAMCMIYIAARLWGIARG